MLLLNKYVKTSKLLLVVYLFLFKTNIVAQTNLIQNGSFELYNTPTNWNNFDGSFYNYSVFPAQRILLNWEPISSPDCFFSACTHTYSGVPVNIFGNSYPKHGDAFIGIGVFDIRYNYQEYIYQNLSSPLIHDSIYCMSFFVSRADRFPFAVKQIGAYFSNNIPSLSSGYINAAPQIVNNTGFLTDTVNWVEIQGCYTAQGGEQYITIGNFNNNTNIDTLRIPSSSPLTGTGTDVAYYYIDSVTLWKNNFPTEITEFNKNKLVNVYPNPANDVINFKFKDATDKRKIELYDSIGELILSEAAPTQNSSLNIHHLANGIYFYSILVNGKTVNTNKIVIIK